MRRSLILIISGLLIAAALQLIIPSETSQSQSTAVSPPEKPTPENRHSGPDWQRRFFENWHRPYGQSMPEDLRRSIWSDVKKLPSEDLSKTGSGWEGLGPAGIMNDNLARFSGRVLDLNGVDGSGLTLASASGGLWQYSILWPHPLTEDLPSQWIGALAIDPHDEETMIIGTGEFWAHDGMGLWKTTDGGITWSHKTMSPEPAAFFRIKYSNNGQTVHAATTAGYYRSSDGGETWTRIYNGAVTDLGIADPLDTSGIIYQCRWNDGLYKSTNDGQQWYHLDDAVLPGSGLARGAVTVSASDPEIVYVAFSHLVWNGGNSAYVMEGVYRTTDEGIHWTDVTPSVNYMGGQAWYNNVISVSPTDPDLLFAGGVRLMRSQDGGATWEEIVDDQLHVDYHAMQWDNRGNYFWVGHDGGLSFSDAQGEPGSWTTDGNNLPITQFTEFDSKGFHWVSASFAGGSQDNGICISTNGGDTWGARSGGDGGGIEFGDSIQDLWIASGIFDDGILFHHKRSYDGGITVTDITNGLPENSTWYPAVCPDGNGRMYTYAGNRVYFRDDDDPSWQTASPDGFGGDITNLTASAVSGSRVLFVCLDTTSQNQMYVYIDGSWHSRKAGLPAAAMVRRVVPHPAYTGWAYALMNGLGTPGQKLYMTTDLGVTWTNITGDLPNMPLADLVVHPDDDDILFLGTGGYGFFRTTDGGAHWERWNKGCPEALMVMEMKTLDLRLFDQGFHVVTATYGRSMWSRNINGDDFSAVENPQPRNDLIVSCQAVPNPFNASTAISFVLNRDAEMEVVVFDLGGRKIRTLLSGYMEAGLASVNWNGLDSRGGSVASGKYLVMISGDGNHAVQEILLAK